MGPWFKTDNVHKRDIGCFNTHFHVENNVFALTLPKVQAKLKCFNQSDLKPRSDQGLKKQRKSKQLQCYGNTNSAEVQALNLAIWRPKWLQMKSESKISHSFDLDKKGDSQENHTQIPKSCLEIKYFH